jgi:5-methylcytosine-specific restriction endonuclease McrA
MWELTADAMADARLVPLDLGQWEATEDYYWIYADVVYATPEPDLTSDDVDALLNEQANRRRLQIERAKSVRAMTQQLDGRGRRERIPQPVKVLIWQRDGGRCVACDSDSDLEFDHIIPLAMGGSNSERNLQLLCGDCNRRKGATLG